MTRVARRLAPPTTASNAGRSCRRNCSALVHISSEDMTLPVTLSSARVRISYIAAKRCSRLVLDSSSHLRFFIILRRAV